MEFLRTSYEYAEKTCDALPIVSAFFGVITLKSVIHTHDRSLRQYTKRKRENWGVRTIGQFLSSFTESPQLAILADKLHDDALAVGAVADTRPSS